MKNYDKNNLRVGIMFYDNDFGITIKSFLKLLGESQVELTKAKVVEMFNFCAPALYVLTQNHQREWSDHLDGYLRIEEKNVYFNEEIDPMAADWQNYEFHWLEKDGEVYSR